MPRMSNKYTPVAAAEEEEQQELTQVRLEMVPGLERGTSGDSFQCGTGAATAGVSNSSEPLASFVIPGDAWQPLSAACLQQLDNFFDTDPEAIPILLDKWPQVVNLRDSATGDTIMHRCARSSTSDFGEPRDRAEKWLSGTVPFEPLTNHNGLSALALAIKNNHLGIAQYMVRDLDTRLPVAKTNVVTEDLVAIAEKWPRNLVDFIRLLEEPRVTSKHPMETLMDSFLFRNLRPIYLAEGLVPPKGYDVRASVRNIKLGDAKWNRTACTHAVEYEPAGAEAQKSLDARKCSRLQVMALRGFAAAPTREELAPYARMCNAAAPAGQLGALLETEPGMQNTGRGCILF